jgi:hypothetical protein
MSTPAYGLDAELAAKAAAKFDPEMEKEVCDWIEALSGCPKGDQKTEDWLHDGQVLCKLANAVKPGCVKKINTSAMVFKQRENITYFQTFCRDVGVAEISMFGTDDLFDAKNMGSVLSSIFILGGVIQDKLPNFSGPKLGVAVHSSVADGKRNVGPATQTGGLSGAMEVQKLFGGKREVAGGTCEGVSAPSVDGADAAGLDADIAKRNAAKLAALGGLEGEVCSWISSVSGESKSGSTHDWLKSGQVLCKLANKLKPGVVANINTMSTPFKERENITYFQAFMRTEIPESAMFGTDDLYEQKDLATFLLSVNAFAGAIQGKPAYSHVSSKLGAAMSHNMGKDVKRDGLTATSQQEAMQRAMQVERPKETGITAGARAGQ